MQIGPFLARARFVRRRSRIHRGCSYICLSRSLPLHSMWMSLWSVGSTSSYNLSTGVLSIRMFRIVALWIDRRGASAVVAGCGFVSSGIDSNSLWLGVRLSHAIMMSSFNGNFVPVWSRQSQFRQTHSSSFSTLGRWFSIVVLLGFRLSPSKPWERPAVSGSWRRWSRRDA